MHGGIQPELQANYNRDMFGCVWCPKMFPNKSKLERHARIHTGEKPFACEECGRRFNVKTNLKTHWITQHQIGKKRKKKTKLNEPS